MRKESAQTYMAFFKQLRGKRLAAAIVFAAMIILLLCVFAFDLMGVRSAFGQMAPFLKNGQIRRAILVGALVSLCAALLGVSLVLKRYSMIGDGLSHVGFGTLTITMCSAYITPEMLPAFLSESARANIAGFLSSVVPASSLQITLVVVVIFAFILLRISESSKIKGDAAIAVISTSALALGVIVTSLNQGMNANVYSYLFGSLLAISASDVYLSIGLTLPVLALFAVFYHRIFAITFDENFAKATGLRAGVYKMLLATLSAVTIVVGMRMMGTMLISSLIIFPALTAMRICSRFRMVVLAAAGISLLSLGVGVVFSCLYGFPTGASVVCVNLLLFLLASLFSIAKSRK